MQEYLVLIHKTDNASSDNEAGWAKFLADLDNKGVLRGGSSLGTNTYLNISDVPEGETALTGYMKIATSNFQEAQDVCANIPDYQSGATIQICLLVRD